MFLLLEHFLSQPDKRTSIDVQNRSLAGFNVYTYGNTDIAKIWPSLNHVRLRFGTYAITGIAFANWISTAGRGYRGKKVNVHTITTPGWSERGRGTWWLPVFPGLLTVSGYWILLLSADTGIDELGTYVSSNMIGCDG